MENSAPVSDFCNPCERSTICISIGQRCPLNKGNRMDKIFTQATEHFCSELANRIETHIEGVRVNNLGSQLVLMFDNKSVATVYPLTADTVDVFAKDPQDHEWDLKELSIPHALEFLAELAAIQPHAIQETDRLREPFGRDPLGAKERSEGRCLQESTLPRMLYGSELFRYLKEVLPVAEDEAFVDDAGNFIVAVEPLRVRVVPKGSNLYDVETFIGDKREPQQVQLSHGETVRYVFDLVAAVEKVNPPSPALAGDEGEEIDTADAYEVLRELAGELGKPKDILRNKDLVNLRAGLVQEGQTHQSATSDLLSGLDRHLQRFENLKHESGGTLLPDATPKAKWFRGHPVAIGQDGMDGKTLRYVQGIGAVLVDKQDVPPPNDLKLSWNDSKGAVLVPVTEATNRPSWKPFR